MEAILKSLAGWAFSLVRDYSLCFVLVRLWAWSAVEALHLPPHLMHPDMPRGNVLRSLHRSTMRVAYMMGLNWGRGRRSIAAGGAVWCYSPAGLAGRWFR